MLGVIKDVNRLEGEGMRSARREPLIRTMVTLSMFAFTGCHEDEGDFHRAPDEGSSAHASDSGTPSEHDEDSGAPSLRERSGSFLIESSHIRPDVAVYVDFVAEEFRVLTPNDHHPSWYWGVKFYFDEEYNDYAFGIDSSIAESLVQVGNFGFCEVEPYYFDHEKKEKQRFESNQMYLLDSDERVDRAYIAFYAEETDLGIEITWFIDKYNDENGNPGYQPPDFCD